MEKDNCFIQTIMLFQHFNLCRLFSYLRLLVIFIKTLGNVYWIAFPIPDVGDYEISSVDKS